MNRLLQGDVGSGKTLVAAAAVYVAAQSGYQSVLMAPTRDICLAARRHAGPPCWRHWAFPCALLTAAVKGAARQSALRRHCARVQWNWW